MKYLVYTQEDGLTEAEELNRYIQLADVFAYGKVIPELHPGWFKRTLVTETLGVLPYFQWERVNRKDLPKRLKVEALLLSIEV